MQRQQILASAIPHDALDQPFLEIRIGKARRDGYGGDTGILASDSCDD
jgi:hypothetical protein